MIAEVRERLGGELERLSRQLTDDLAAEMAGEGRAPAEERSEVQGKIRRLGQLVAGLSGLDGGTLSVDRAGFGSSVVLENVATRDRVSYTLVTGDVIDLDDDQVSLASPIGQALLGRRTGDRVAVETPVGTLRYRIVSLTTLPKMLGWSRGSRTERAPSPRQRVLAGAARPAAAG